MMNRIYGVILMFAPLFISMVITSGFAFACIVTGTVAAVFLCMWFGIILFFK